MFSFIVDFCIIHTIDISYILCTIIIFNIRALLRPANAHLFVERSSEDHDSFHVCDEHCLY